MSSYGPTSDDRGPPSPPPDADRDRDRERSRERSSRRRGRSPSYSPSPPGRGRGRDRSRSRSPPRRSYRARSYSPPSSPPRSRSHRDDYDDRYRGRDYPRGGGGGGYGGGGGFPPDDGYRGGGGGRGGPPPPPYHRDPYGPPPPHHHHHPYMDPYYPPHRAGPPPPPMRGDMPGPPPGRRDGRRRDEGPPGVSLLIRNVSPDITTQDLQTAFGRIGEIRDVYIPRDYHSHQPKGFAFIEYATPALAAEAREEMNRFVIKGRELEVVFAQERRKTPNEMRGRVVNQQNHLRSPERQQQQRSSSFERAQRRDHERADEPNGISNGNSNNNNKED